MLLRSHLFRAGLKPVLLYPRCMYPTYSRLHLLYVDFSNPVSVRNFLKRLSDEERSHLTTSLNSDTFAMRTVTPLSTRDLCIVSFSNGFPFIGFGFLDNALMISAGGTIETTFGSMMGISTMAAAALGNWISDVIGMGTTGYVETVCQKFGIRPPEMTSEQMELFSTRFYTILGRCLGITIGCFLGMFPLLFYDNEKTETG